jgi:hypothetical protein
MKTPDNFKGLELEPDSFATYIACMLDTVRVLQMSSDESLRATGNKVLDIATEYANAVASNESRKAETKCGGL